MRTSRAATAILAAFILTLTVATTAVAGKPTTEVRNDRFSFSFVDDEICPGLEILSSFENVKRTRTVFYDRAGSEKLVIHVEGWGTFTNVADPSLTVRSHFTRRIVFDEAAGTYTDTGAYRNVTVAGDGSIFQQTGRWVETLDEPVAVLAIAGPHDEWLNNVDGFCGALGR